MGKFFSQPAVYITVITAIATFCLALLKLWVGISGDSHALTADGFHSFADILIDGMVLFAAHFGAQKADYNHPYGHGRIETAATFGLSLILTLTGLGIILDAGKHIWGHQTIPSPEKITLWIAIITAVVNEGLFQITLKISKKVQSDILAANAWHARSDVWVSGVVILGIFGALMGFRYLDIIGAIIVGMMIIKLGAEWGWKSISELVDTGVDEATLKKIKTLIIEIPGVKTLHMLRTRTIKNKILVDVHILVSPRISVSEGHFISEQVIIALKTLPDISDITVHVDPEDDEIMHISSQLPDRQTVETLLKQKFVKLAYANKIKLGLHYLNGKLSVEIYIPINFPSSDDLISLTQNYKDIVRQTIAPTDNINVYFFTA